MAACIVENVLSYPYEVVFLEAPKVVSLCIGVDEYENANYRLASCVQEATQFSAAITRSSRSCSSIIENAGSKSELIMFIRESLRCFDQACPEVVMIFLACRCVTIEDETFFAPCKFKFDSKGKGEVDDYALSMNKLFSLLKEFEGRSRFEDKNLIPITTFVVIADTFSHMEIHRSPLQRPGSESVPTSWCLSFSCRKVQLEFRNFNSPFFGSIMDVNEGIFGINKKIRESLMYCAANTSGRDHFVEIINSKQISQDLCLHSSNEPKHHAEIISQAVANVVESMSTSNSSCTSQLHSESMVLLASCSSHQEFNLEEVLKVSKECLIHMLEDSPHEWTMITSFLFGFFWSKDTTCSSVCSKSYYKCFGSTLRQADFENINDDLFSYRIFSPAFDAWLISTNVKIPNDKLCIALIDFTAMNLLRKMDQAKLLQSWKERIMVECYSIGTTLKQALDYIEEFLRELIHSDQGKSILLNGYALKDLSEVNNKSLIILKISEVESYFFALIFMQDSTKTRSDIRLRPWANFRTWVCSSGWMISGERVQEDWRVRNENWASSLRASFERLLEIQMHQDWISFAQAFGSGRNITMQDFQH
eukprot:760284-Hanusia_phi.AAC.3